MRHMGIGTCAALSLFFLGMGDRLWAAVAFLIVVIGLYLLAVTRKADEDADARIIRRLERRLSHSQRSLSMERQQHHRARVMLNVGQRDEMHAWQEMAEIIAYCHHLGYKNVTRTHVQKWVAAGRPDLRTS